MIAGLGLNMTVAALTAILLQVVWNSASNSPAVESVPHMTVPVLSEIPILGALFTSQSVVTLFGILIVPVVWIILFNTVFGMRIRGDRKQPLYGKQRRGKRDRYKYTVMLICGGFAGLR